MSHVSSRSVRVGSSSLPCCHPFPQALSHQSPKLNLPFPLPLLTYTQVFQKTGAAAALAAGIFHRREVAIQVGKGPGEAGGESGVVMMNVRVNEQGRGRG